jgi:hypothetical protein
MISEKDFKSLKRGDVILTIEHVDGSPGAINKTFANQEFVIVGFGSGGLYIDVTHLGTGIRIHSKERAADLGIDDGCMLVNRDIIKVSTYRHIAKIVKRADSSSVTITKNSTPEDDKMMEFFAYGEKSHKNVNSGLEFL